MILWQSQLDWLETTSDGRKNIVDKYGLTSPYAIASESRQEAVSVLVTNTIASDQWQIPLPANSELVLPETVFAIGQLTSIRGGLILSS